MSSPRILVITGPTGSGKSKFGIELAEHFNGEIISADSVQVYRGFDIGSGKVTADEARSVPHHLLSILDPNEEWSAGHFRSRALETAQQVVLRGKVPVVVGGTGLYIRALLNGLIEPAGDIEGARAQVAAKEEALKAQGLNENEVQSELLQWLASLTNESISDPTERTLVRVRRALIVALATGSSISELWKNQTKESGICALVISLEPERSELYKSINDRVVKMFADGFVGEVRALIEQGYGDTKPMNSIGYRQVSRCVRGEISEAQALEFTQQDTRNFAKRQFTWWRHQPEQLGWKTVNSTPIQLTFSAMQANISRFLDKHQEFQEYRNYFLRAC